MVCLQYRKHEELRKKEVIAIADKLELGKRNCRWKITSGINKL